MITVGNKTYELIHEHKNGWNQESFRARYSEVLERYDYIVGDWGYNQLRLKGFFRDNHPKASKDALIGTVQDYLNEYCNFGCAYFVLQKVPTPVKDKERKSQEHQEPADANHSNHEDDAESGLSKQQRSATEPEQLEPLGGEPAQAETTKAELRAQHENKGYKADGAKRDFQRRDWNREESLRNEGVKREHGRRDAAKSGHRAKPKQQMDEAGSKKEQTPQA
ncbi:DUF1027 domain-containing protein [Xylanibacillus composti]|uniref:DUF1027 domain-containing protein n=1 Tax=Xylanibacillus composti TaxID=1572762 RepID=A0A8J4H037_9BACL|nr:YutD family protein [Xylanibacillus composti]MDT9723545.1 DUF1027 domain-containing protein [Xylanibacillus composti]GIQ68417.1 hypothetical protein XYCOK13_12410 [Xylanibacillus composti]